MPSAEEDDRAVFANEDDDDVTDGDGSDEEDDSGEGGTAAAPPHPPHPPQPENTSDSITPNPNPNTNLALVVISSETRRPLSSSFDESRRLFQRLWTDDDEITILKGFLDFTTRRGTAFASHQYDTDPFYHEIKKQLQLEFTKNQLIEKLRRLKKKYRNCINRMQKAGKDFAFKSSHEEEIHEIARNIWSAGIKRAHDSDDDDVKPSSHPNFSDSKRFRKRSVEDSATVVPVTVTEENPIPPSSSAMINGVIEETVRSCLSPLFKELINSAIGGGQVGGDFGLLGLNALPLSLGANLLNTSGTPIEGKWRKQQIMELEVYLKRIELVKEQIKSKLEELNSSAS